MKVKVIEAFTDKLTGIDRKVDDLFECTTERGEQLISYKLVAMVEGGKDNLSAQELKKKEKDIISREASLIEKEKALELRAAELEEKEKQFYLVKTEPKKQEKK